jgi:NAD(P)-dependent dehydrogenase (short-subunit alcohol dehydrogenase family)
LFHFFKRTLQAGIGRESALLFAQNGVEGLVLADFSPEGQKTADDIKNQFGTRAVFIKTDVSKESDCKAMIDIGEKTFGKVNVLFNNAGIMMGGCFFITLFI